LSVKFLASFTFLFFPLGLKRFKEHFKRFFYDDVPRSFAGFSPRNKKALGGSPPGAFLNNSKFKIKNSKLPY